VNGVDLDAAGLDPLFDRATALGVPLFIHPYRVMADHRMTVHFLSNICGNPFETTLAAMRLYLGGIFDRWPEVKLVLAHAGGVLPMLAGRASHAFQHCPSFDAKTPSPDSMMEMFYFDTVLHDARALAFALTVIGPIRFAAGTDSPFPMCLEDPIAHVAAAAASADVGFADQRRILEDTAMELFGLRTKGVSEGSESRP
jgi:aminocarboxymuconate-semialdehyde decarboxylase